MAGKVNDVVPIKLNDWDELDSFFDKLIEIKDNQQRTSSVLELVKEEIETTTKTETSIAILISTPIDREILYTFEEIIKKFIKYKVIIDCFHFSIDTLRNLDGYDYIILFSQIVRNKLVIEDKYLKSKLVTFQEIEENLITDHLKGVLIFIDKESALNVHDIKIPILVNWSGDLSGFIFKFFQKRAFELIDKSLIVNKKYFSINSFNKGNPQISMPSDRCKVKLSGSIDSKNLINFVGRKTDLEDIIRKLIDINNKILTIKGSGGIGKTATIKKVAIDLFERGHYIDGIFFIDCEFINNYQSFEYKISQCFEIDSSINLKDHISQNNIRIDGLIILDNFEPLLYIEDIEAIKILLTFICEYSDVVITSREWIDLEFEERHELRAFTNEEALQLFYKYHKSSINNDDIKVLKEDILGKLLNNNPLAIKIITKVIPKSKNMQLLKNELETDFFSITESGYDDIFDDMADANIERSKSLYQSIAYSYKRLLPNEKLLFETLSLFPDGIHMSNVKKFFSQGYYKKDARRITDREINALENKSLIEINKGFIKLQSIIGRFAEHQFLKRTSAEKVEFYERAFNFINFVVDKIFSFSDNSLGSRVFDQNIQNCSKCISYLNLYDGDELEKLVFIFRVFYWARHINRTNYFDIRIPQLKRYFENIEKADILLDSILITSNYYEGDFEEAYIQLQKLIPIDSMHLLDANDPVQYYILVNVINVYKYRNVQEIRKLVINKQNDFHNHLFLNELLFHTGEYEKYLKLNKLGNDLPFFTFEVQYNTNSLDKELLDEYIESLYKKQYTELMQTNYIKAKQGRIEKKIVNKLVVTNSYTSGLKLLMLAFIEDDTEKARNYYESAIDDLQPIRYYYTEAVYYYAKYLLDHNLDGGNEWIEKGLLLARENYYRVLIHKFDCLITGSNEPYKESIYEIPSDLTLDGIIAEYYPKNQNICN